MSPAELQSLIVVTANILMMGAVIGLLFSTLAQPRRERVNGVFALFLVAMGMWAYARLALHIPAIRLFGRLSTFYLDLFGLGLVPISFYFFVIVFCPPGHIRLSRLLSVWAVLSMGALTVLLWNGQLVAVHEAGRDLGTGVAVDVWAHFDILPIGYLGLGNVVAYNVLSYVYLRFSRNAQSKALQLPALLLVLAYVADFIDPLARLPFDTVIATVAALLIGYTVLRFQLFSPLRETNEQLRVTNRDLRLTVGELAAEKERAEKLNEELRAANRYKSAFLANMSHELRTPLNSIVGYSELLLQNLYGTLTPQQADRLEKIHRNGRNLLTLISDILDLSKIEAGRLELAPQHVTFRELIDEVLATVEPLAQSKGLTLSANVPQDLRPLYVDALRLRQVLNNLLSNAVKFTHEGTVTVAARNVAVVGGRSAMASLPVWGWLGDGDWVLITVTDSGIGIAPEHQATIFEEFRQVDGTATREYSGTGLGLAISRRLVELHNGRIWVQSMPGEGSTFFLALPASSVVAPVQEAVPLDDARYGAGQHVLVIDDSQEAADILSTYLRHAGYRVTCALDGKTGIRLARELHPDLITTDIMMPGMNGWEVIEQLKADPDLAGVPILIVSIVDQQPMNMALGASAHLSKPVQRDQLLHTVARLQRHAPEHPILIVDDNPGDLEIIGEILHAEGYPFAICRSGQEAMDWLERNRASLVLLDLLMPQVSGFDVLTHIRKTPNLDDLPVIVVSAKDISTAEEDFLNGRIADIIKKQGMARGDLLARIQRVLA